jgi:predicted GNAT superfamily acetyltransferase
VQAASLAEAAAWRRGTRAALVGLHDLGYRVSGFRRDEGSGACGYLLTSSRSPGEAA